jgi:hypothetical protein
MLPHLPQENGTTSKQQRRMRLPMLPLKADSGVVRPEALDGLTSAGSQNQPGVGFVEGNPVFGALLLRSGRRENSWPTPEPESLLLLATDVAPLALRRRRA